MTWEQVLLYIICPAIAAILAAFIIKLVSDFKGTCGKIAAAKREIQWQINCFIRDSPRFFMSKDRWEELQERRRQLEVDKLDRMFGINDYIEQNNARKAAYKTMLEEKKKSDTPPS